MRLFLLFFLSIPALYADELSDRVHRYVLDQLNPCTVYVSMTGITTMQFPATIKAVDGGNGFSTKPDEPADFYIFPGDNWLSVQSGRVGAEQNLSIVIRGKVYEVYLKTAALNDFSVIFRFPETAKRAPIIWSPVANTP